MCREHKQRFELLHDWMRRWPQLGHLCSDDDDMNNDDNDDYDDDDNDYDDDYNDYNDDDDDDDVHDCMRRRGLSSATCAPTMMI